jgi:hypothetical protein
MKEKNSFSGRIAIAIKNDNSIVSSGEWKN